MRTDTPRTDAVESLARARDEGWMSADTLNAIDLARTLERELASFRQAVLDPENQPSQHGTVTLEYHNRALSKAAGERDDLLKYLKAVTDEDGTHHPDWVADCQTLERELAEQNQHNHRLSLDNEALRRELAEARADLAAMQRVSDTDDETIARLERSQRNALEAAHNVILTWNDTAGLAAFAPRLDTNLSKLELALTAKPQYAQEESHE